jgi:hypothetical protein
MTHLPLQLPSSDHPLKLLSVRKWRCGLPC